MSEQIEFHVPRYDLAITIELLGDLAPNTVAALTAALPATGLVTCEDRYGSVVCLRVPNISRPLPMENASIFPTPGDVFIFERERGVEIVVFYERSGSVPAGVPFDSIGAKAGDRIGIVGNIRSSAIPAAARRIWSDGAAWGAMAAVGTVMIQSIRDDGAAATAEIARRLLDWRRRTGRDHLGPVPGVGRRVALSIPEFGARTEVELADDAAPQTCDEVWNHLPVETTLMHGRYSGPEMFTQVGGKQWHWTPRAENGIAQPIAGDLVIYYDPPPRIQINYFHDRDAIPYGTPAPEVGNLIGWSVGDFSQFAEGCLRVEYEGWKTLVVERVE